MESFHPGVKSIVFALLCAFLITKKGRQLGIRLLVLRGIKSKLLFWLPLKVRCEIVKKVMGAPTKKGRAQMKSLTKPWGEQWDYITRGPAGHWIVSPKEQGSMKLKEIEATTSDGLIIYYMHGGGFRMGDSVMYMEAFIHIIERLRKKGLNNTRIYSLEYKCLPEGTHEDAKQECLAGYRYLTKTLRIPSQRIILAGDSAGGNLVAVCLQEIIRSQEFDLPLGNIMISPWISIEKNAQVVEEDTSRYLDCITYKDLNSHQEYDEFFAHKDFKDASISPLFESFKGFCPTLVTYGGTEIFQHDVEELIEKLKQDQVKTTVINRSNAPHVWIICPFLSPTLKIWEEDCSKLADWCFELYLSLNG